MKRVVCLMLVLCLTVGLLAGCGEKSELGVAAVGQFDIKINGKTARAIKEGENFYCRDGEITFLTDDDEKTQKGEMTVCSAGCGNTVQEVIDVLNIKPGYACFDYEYDPYGDGCTEIGSAVYDGTVFTREKLEELSVLDLNVFAYYSYENGEWLPIDLGVHELDEYDTVLKIGFDTEGVHDLYGKNCGEVFAVECGILTD